MFISTAGADLHVIDPKSDELSKLAKVERVAAAGANSNDFVNTVSRL